MADKVNLQDGFKEFQLDRYDDERGWFINSYEFRKYQALIGNEVDFVMDNFSHSQKGVLRGMHFQRESPQGKLVTVVKGAIYDVVVDLRKDSITFGKWQGVEVSLKRANQVWVPPGFAHGFLALEESIVHYKTTDFYVPEDQYIIKWDDSEIGIEWPVIEGGYILSERDLLGDSLRELIDSQ